MSIRPCRLQTGDVDPALVEPAVRSPTSTAVFGCQSGIDQCPHRPVRVQERTTVAAGRTTREVGQDGKLLSTQVMR
ncbi:hypothetical protein ADL00_45010 [Streptomyces sp. AS58]|nr:hypothetical protein ADL00_45010 [Streptomyces sp. AS58]